MPPPPSLLLLLHFLQDRMMAELHARGKTAEDIRRELQELQRQHREVRPPPCPALLEASVLPWTSTMTRFRPPRRSPSAFAIPAVFAAAPPALDLDLDPGGPARFVAS